MAFGMKRRRAATAAAALVLCFIVGYAEGQTQTVVDDDDSSIVYSPEDSWFRNPDVNPMDAGGHHMVTTDSSATATFRFTGTGISYMAPLWAEEITTQVTLDGGLPVVIDLQDKTVPAEVDGATTVESSILWQERGLANTEHVLVISVPPGGRFAVVDALVVEQDDDDSSTTSTSETTDAIPTTSSASSTSTESPTSSRTQVGVVATSPTASPTPATKAGLTIAIAVTCSVAGVLLILLLLFFLARRRRQRKEREAWARMNREGVEGGEGGGPLLSPPEMDLVDDGITAPPKQRFRSIPTRNGSFKTGMYGAGGGYKDEDNVSQQSNGTGVSASGKGASKLRQVVATDEDMRMRVGVGVGGVVQSNAWNPPALQHSGRLYDASSMQAPQVPPRT